MIKLEGELTRTSIRDAQSRLTSEQAENGRLEVDMSGVTHIDSTGVALLALTARRLAESGDALHLTSVQPAVQATLELFPEAQTVVIESSRSPWFERVGETTLGFAEIGLEYLRICADAFWFFITGLKRPRSMRWPVVVFEMSSLGSKALGVVTVISFLVGATLALQSAQQLRQFGANVFAADLVGISITREIGPLMAAIVVAGRSGSAVAAEIGTMVVTEEVDALKTMGIHPIRFLVLPKLLAITITQPLLTVLADFAGIFGGLIVSTVYLDVSPGVFINRLEIALYIKDILTGLFKAVVFAQLIVTVGAACGFRTRGGADAVGRSTTTSVVAGIFAVIAADAVCSLMFYLGD